MIKAMLIYIAALYFLGWAVRGLIDAARNDSYAKGFFDGKFAGLATREIESWRTASPGT